MDMKQILVYADSLSWGIIPNTRNRLPFPKRWPGVVESVLNDSGLQVRVIEDCLNGRRTLWEDPIKPVRNGLDGLEQRIEINSPLALVILFLGTNDFQAMHENNAQQSAEGISKLIHAIRQAPIERGMPVPEILVVAPPPIQKAKGNIAAKFEGAELKSAGLTSAIEAIAQEANCPFFDAGNVTQTSKIDGVHLDEDQHQTLGMALAEKVRSLLVS